MANTQCHIKDQLEEHGIILDGKWAFNPIRTYKPNRIKLKNFFTDLDSTQACNRFKWVGGPKYFAKYIIEQKLYTRSALVFFKDKLTKTFKLLPFTRVGKLNEDGFIVKVRPIPYNGETEDIKEATGEGTDYNVDNYGDLENDENKCVILYDRINVFSKNSGGIPKAILQDTIITEIVNRLSFLNINLVNSQGKNIILVKDPKQAKAVERSLESIYASDKSFSILKSNFEVQVINNEIDYQEQALWEDAMSWNNLRLEGLGINNNGLFNKKERQITGEQNANEEQTEIMTDAFYEARKLFIEQIKETFKNDEDFKRDFADFNVIDTRVNSNKNNAKNSQNTDDSEEGENEYDNINF